MYGLTCNHAFSLLDIIELKNDTEIYEKLLKLRDPFGRLVQGVFGEYSGKYKNSSTVWTPEVISQIASYNSILDDGGVFYMPIDEFAEAFNSYTVAFY